MSKVGRRLFVLSVVSCLTAPAWAEDGPTNLDAGKSPAQLFNSDCAICHKSPQGLAKGGGLLGIESFLRSHYTASRETAASLARYLEGVGSPAAPAQRATKKQPPKGDAKKPATDPAKTPGKPDEPKASGAKPADAQPVAAKPAEKPAEKPADKPAEAKPADKPAETKSE